MAKITNLDPAGPLTGNEHVPLVQNGVTRRGFIGSHIASLAMPFVAQAEEARDVTIASAAIFYTTKELGEAASGDGIVFAVAPGDGTATYWKKGAPSQELFQMATKALVDNLKPFSDLAAFKSQPVANQTATLVQDGISVDYAFVNGDFTGKINDANYIQSDIVEASVGAWVQQKLGYLNAPSQTVSGKSLAPNETLQGLDRRKASIVIQEGESGYIFNPTSTARNKLSGLRISSKGATRAAGSIGVSTANSSLGVLRDYSVWGFDIGILDNETPRTSDFSARNLHESFEANDCNTGIKIFGGNVNTYNAGRVWKCTTGVDLDDAESIVFINVNIESCDTAIKSRDSQISLFGGYIEAGGTPGRKAFDLDTISQVQVYGLKVNGPRGNDEVWDPTASEWHLDAKDTSATKARLSFIPAASKQYIRNPDFSRGSLGWNSGSGLTAELDTTVHESAGQSMKLTPSAAGSYFRTTFNVEKDATVISVAIRFKMASAGLFRVNMYAGTTVVAQYSYAATGPTDWLTATLTKRDYDTSQITDIRIYPDVSAGAAVVNVDQVWANRGHFISAPRRYESGVDLLATPVELVSKTVSANQTDVVALPNVPTGATGCRIRIKASATLAETHITRIFLAKGSAAFNISHYVDKNDREYWAEFSLPFTDNIDIRAFVGSAANSLTYSVYLIEWIL